MLALSLRGAERRSNLDLGAHCPTRLLRCARNDSHSIGFDQPDLVSYQILVIRTDKNVMARLDPWAFSPRTSSVGIHVFKAATGGSSKSVDARHKAGRDDFRPQGSRSLGSGIKPPIRNFIHNQ